MREESSDLDRQRIEALGHAYDEWHAQAKQVAARERKSEFYRMIIKVLGLESGKTILDVGCGKGVFLSLAHERGLSTFGIDISRVAVEMARETTPKSEIKVGIGEQLPWAANYFDYVTCLGSLEHFLKPENAVKEMARVLKPNGLCCIMLPNSYFVGHVYLVYRYGIPPDEGGQMFSGRAATRTEWQNLLETNGLRVLRTHRFNPRQGPQKVKRITALIYNMLLRPFIPFNLSNLFIFICQKRQS